MKESEIKQGMTVYAYQGEGRVWEPRVTAIYDNGVVGIRWGNASIGYRKDELCRRFSATYPAMQVNLWKIGQMVKTILVIASMSGFVLFLIALAGKVWRAL